jgi:hypothetical protein
LISYPFALQKDGLWLMLLLFLPLPHLHLSPFHARGLSRVTRIYITSSHSTSPSSLICQTLFHQDSIMSTLPETKDWARELFLHGHFSDMIINCRGVEFKAHRSIVCTQSAFFDNVIQSGSNVFSENPW